MKKVPVGKIVIAIVIYSLLFLLGSTSGLLGPAVYAYVGTVLPILFAFVYLYTASEMQSFGAAAILNGSMLIISFIIGEGNWALAVGLIVFAALAEIIRKVNGYDTLKGIRLSFIPFAFSFYAYSAHWWTETATSLQEAVEEMPAGYADKMEAVISNIPMLVRASQKKIGWFFCPILAPLIVTQEAYSSTRVEWYASFFFVTNPGEATPDLRYRRKHFGKCQIKKWLQSTEKYSVVIGD